MFQSGLLDHTNERFLAAGAAAFGIFIETYSAVFRTAVDADAAKSNPAVLRHWALVHGLATLAVQGQFGPHAAPTDIARQTVFARKALADAQKYDLRG
jgi:hypothetical protein